MALKNSYLSYSYAIYELAVETKKVSQLNKEIHDFLEELDEKPEIIDYLAIDSEILHFDEKEKFIDEIFKDYDELFLNTIKVIVQNHLSKHIRYIFENVIVSLNKYEGIQEGIIFTTMPLNKETIKKFEEKLSKQEEKKVFLKNKIDKNIVSGFRIILADKIIEKNISHQLSTIKSQLLGGGDES
ncbi:ATP synthase F1 subunit delta [Mycoplasma phocimorsus]|uniref:ATP synthase F1 subunit delta n=1 Tax=Mycoplasma phocimorsus TaxID=3045839 RepID=UPI0024BF271F|nr:ATP synthase F1 subunit delta [Mycoplasma phocimorsus]MDJ1648659.1 ATP synthase F1 subunit delta [Mycoplasma phocimorsus]